MTTVAFDGRYVAADGRSTMGNMVVGKEVQKIFPLDFVYNGVSQKAAVVGAGCQESVHIMVEFIKNNDLAITELAPDVDPEEFELILVLNDGRAMNLGAKLTPFPCEVPFAIGSGAQFALGALHSGQSAKQAVDLATTLDAFSGGQVQVFDLNTMSFIE